MSDQADLGHILPSPFKPNKVMGCASIVTLQLQDPVASAKAVIDAVGRQIRLGVPNGIGKPNSFINALYGLAEADRRLHLKIFTGLTLVRPSYRSDLERRFVAPLLDRLFPTWPDLSYAEAIRAGALPPNIEVHEFFLQAGQWLNNTTMQQCYASLGYSHVADNMRRQGANVMAQLVAPQSGGDTTHVSMSSNTDIALDMRDYIAERRRNGPPIVTLCEVNANLPYMPGRAEVLRGEFDIILHPDEPHYDLFAPPKEPVPLTDYAMGLHAATLIKDGGTLQIGIGSLADAVVHALILRHRHNHVFRDLIAKLAVPPGPDAELGPFTEGLYGCSEMLVDGFLALRRAGILRRKVSLTANADLKSDQTAPVGDPNVIMHAGFFLGCRAFYDELRSMPRDELEQIAMTAISFTNSLLGDTAGKIAQRRHARFINTAMVATLLGATSADQLEDGRVVSGIGGQAEFVAMAHDLPGARAITAVRSVHQARGGRTASNLVWRYANASVPRHLRDIFISEYGIADVRGRSDHEVVAAMLAIADSAFQPDLERQAKRVGKLPADFTLPGHATANRRDRIAAALSGAREAGYLPRFPLGTEMTETEQALLTPLVTLRSAKPAALAAMLVRGMTKGPRSEGERAPLARMGLTPPATARERALAALVLGAIRTTTQARIA